MTWSRNWLIVCMRSSRRRIFLLPINTDYLSGNIFPVAVGGENQREKWVSVGPGGGHCCISDALWTWATKSEIGLKYPLPNQIQPKKCSLVAIWDRKSNEELLSSGAPRKQSPFIIARHNAVPEKASTPLSPKNGRDWLFTFESAGLVPLSRSWLRS